MTAAAAEFDRLEKMISTLHEDDVEKVFSYVAFLNYLQRLEDEEDLRDIAAREDEEEISFEDVKKELGLE